MPITPWLATVNKLVDGQSVSSEVLEPLFTQHTQREQYLYEKINELSNKSILIDYDVPILPAEIPYITKYSVVFYDRQSSTEGVSRALTKFNNLSPHQSTFTIANDSYSFGIVKSINGSNADIYLLGVVELDVNIDNPTYGLMQSDETNASPTDPFEPGPLYLSRIEVGKLTRNPGGVSIYVGYALNRTKLFLSPNVNEFNQFFATYRYNLMDRPAGIPVLTSSTWTITNVDLNVVGWVPVASLPSGLQLLAPAGAVFYYNLPDTAKILADTGITYAEAVNQAELGTTLPPNPPNLTLLTINGVIQNSRDTDLDGIYQVNEAGIWWFSNTNGFQPWASDIADRLLFTALPSPDELQFAAVYNFSINDIIYAKPVSGSWANNLDISVKYYVKTITNGGQNVTLSTTKGPSFSPVGILTDSNVNGYVPQPYIWKLSKGTNSARPRMALQFIKFNPSLRSTIVTSLKKFNSGSDIISFYGADKLNQKTTGDLLARVNLKFTDNSSTTASTAISSLTYDETTGVVLKNNTPIISKLTEGSGISILPETIGGAVQPGSYIISTNLNKDFGHVDSIEPDGADLIFTGLHSYLNMTLPAVTPSSITGKILLPATTPSADMKFVIFLAAISGLGSGAITTKVTFDFSYSVTQVGAALGTSTSTSAISFDLPAPITAKTVLKIGNATADTYSIPVPALSIPAVAFNGGDKIINFKLARTTPSDSSTKYTSDVGIVDIYWTIG
jgi:hypothetical protein